MPDESRVVLLLVSPEKRKAFWNIISTGEINPHHQFSGGSFTLTVGRVIQRDQLICERVCIAGLDFAHIAHNIASGLRLVQITQHQHLTEAMGLGAAPVEDAIYVEKNVTPEILRDAFGFRKEFAEAICEAVRNQLALPQN